MKQYDVDYNVLKSNIVKSCRAAKKEGIEFIINYDKLSRLVDDIGLTIVNAVDIKSDRITVKDIVGLSEYFKDKKLSWFNKYKEFAQLVFVRTDAIDENLSSLLAKMNENEIDNPDLDKVNILAQILASYPCYCATVVSYMSNDPVRFGKPTYMIGCRANTVTITQENYKYNEKDI